MGSGNHLADESDKDRELKGQCSCGGNLYPVDWCEPENCRCEQECGNNLEDVDCLVMEERLLCAKCGAIYKVEE